MNGGTDVAQSISVAKEAVTNSLIKPRTSYKENAMYNEGRILTGITCEGRILTGITCEGRILTGITCEGRILTGIS